MFFPVSCFVQEQTRGVPAQDQGRWRSLAQPSLSSVLRRFDVHGAGLAA
jgi:hypothetical protein